MEKYQQLMMLIIIAGLGAYACYVCRQLWHQKQSAQEVQTRLSQQRSERRLACQESITVLIRCLLQNQVSITEAAIRISGLAKMIEMSEEERRHYQAFDDLAFATSHIPILSEWSRLSAKERYKFTLERETIESGFEERIHRAADVIERMIK